MKELTVEQMNKNIKEKLNKPDAKVCIYHNLNTYERLFYDYYGRWINFPGKEL